MSADSISNDLRVVLRRRLKLSRLLDTLPERLVLARQQKMRHQVLLLVLQDEATRRDAQAATLRARRLSSTRTPCSRPGTRPPRSPSTTRDAREKQPQPV
jgi:hypothetical protein